MSDNVNVNGLAEDLSKAAEIPTSTAVTCVKELFEIIGNHMSEGKTVTINGFGNFTSAHRAERTGRNPATGATMTIPAKNVPVFKAGKKLKDKINK
jgi:DNA-binding protein HU-beta